MDLMGIKHGFLSHFHREQMFDGSAYPLCFSGKTYIFQNLKKVCQTP
jgi:hypothetical protein